MFFGGINPYTLSDEEWASAYCSLQFMLEEKVNAQKNNTI